MKKYSVLMLMIGMFASRAFSMSMAAQAGFARVPEEPEEENEAGGGVNGAADGAPAVADGAPAVAVTPTSTKKPGEEASDPRKSWRIYTGIEFNNREKQDESLWSDQTTFFQLEFVNSHLQWEAGEGLGHFAAGFGLFLEQKAKSASKEEGEMKKEGEMTTGSSSFTPTVPNLQDEIINAETAGLSFGLSRWGNDSNYFNINGRVETYVEVEDPDEAITDWYALVGFSRKPGLPPANGSSNTQKFSAHAGYAHLENLEESDRFYVEFQWDYKLSENDFSSLGLSVQYHTPLRSSVDGEDDLQIRLFWALAPETIERVFGMGGGE